MSVCWFCRVTAHMFNATNNVKRDSLEIQQTKFENSKLDGLIESVHEIMAAIYIPRNATNVQANQNLPLVASTEKVTHISLAFHFWDIGK